jgi:hypothetical protein
VRIAAPGTVQEAAVEAVVVEEWGGYWRDLGRELEPRCGVLEMATVGEAVVEVEVGFLFVDLGRISWARIVGSQDEMAQVEALWLRDRDDQGVAVVVEGRGVRQVALSIHLLPRVLAEPVLVEDGWDQELPTEDRVDRSLTWVDMPEGARLVAWAGCFDLACH